MGKRFCLALVLVSLVSLVCLVTGVVWAVPGVINYQGKLTNTSDCVLSGDYQVWFYLYDAETGGTALWDEVQNVNVDQGLFDAQLGKVSTFPAGLFKNDGLYLEMVIYNPDTASWEKLSPRKRFTSTAYAMNADTVDGKHAGELGSGDGHSLDAADGDPADAVYVDNNGKVGIGTMEPYAKLDLDAGPVMGTEFTRGIRITHGSDYSGYLDASMRHIQDTAQHKLIAAYDRQVFLCWGAGDGSYGHYWLDLVFRAGGETSFTTIASGSSNPYFYPIPLRTYTWNHSEGMVYIQLSRDAPTKVGALKLGSGG